MFDKFIYLIIAIILIYSLINYINLRLALKKGNAIENTDMLSGCEIVTKMLELEHLEKIYVVETKNPLEERYDPNRDVIRLSHKVFNGTSVSDISFAAFECICAIEDKSKNRFIRIRNILLPTINLLIYISYIGIILSSILKDFNFLKISIGLLFILTLLNILSKKEDEKIAKKIVNKFKKMNIKNIENYEDLLESISCYFSAYPFVLLERLIILIKNKINI